VRCRAVEPTLFRALRPDHHPWWATNAVEEFVGGQSEDCLAAMW
jgi:hypothetical protein